MITINQLMWSNININLNSSDLDMNATGNTVNSIAYSSFTISNTELLDDSFNPVTTDDFGAGINITTYNPGNTNTATIQVSIPQTFTAQHIRFTANISGETYYGGDSVDTVTINLSDYCLANDLCIVSPTLLPFDFIEPVLGCTDTSAINYKTEYTHDDESCKYFNYDAFPNPADYNAIQLDEDSGSFYLSVFGQAYQGADLSMLQFWQETGYEFQLGEVGIWADLLLHSSGVPVAGVSVPGLLPLLEQFVVHPLSGDIVESYNYTITYGAGTDIFSVLTENGFPDGLVRDTLRLAGFESNLTGTQSIQVALLPNQTEFPDSQAEPLIRTINFEVVNTFDNIEFDFPDAASQNFYPGETITLNLSEYLDNPDGVDVEYNFSPPSDNELDLYNRFSTYELVDGVFTGTIRLSGPAPFFLPGTYEEADGTILPMFVDSATPQEIFFEADGPEGYFDGSGGASTNVYSFNIVNDEIVCNSTQVTVAEGGTTSIDLSQQINADTHNVGIFYMVGTVGLLGEELETVEFSAEQSGLQYESVYNEFIGYNIVTPTLVSYTHDGTENFGDYFEFFVWDGYNRNDAGNTLWTKCPVNITVTGVDEAPTITTSNLAPFSVWENTIHATTAQATYNPSSSTFDTAHDIAFQLTDEEYETGNVNANKYIIFNVGYTNTGLFETKNGSGPGGIDMAPLHIFSGVPNIPTRYIRFNPVENENSSTIEDASEVLQTFTVYATDIGGQCTGNGQYDYDPWQCNYFGYEYIWNYDTGELEPITWEAGCDIATTCTSIPAERIAAKTFEVRVDPIGTQVYFSPQQESPSAFDEGTETITLQDIFYIDDIDEYGWDISDDIAVSLNIENMGDGAHPIHNCLNPECTEYELGLGDSSSLINIPGLSTSYGNIEVTAHSSIAYRYNVSLNITRGDSDTFDNSNEDGAVLSEDFISSVHGIKFNFLAYIHGASGNTNSTEYYENNAYSSVILKFTNVPDAPVIRYMEDSLTGTELVSGYSENSVVFSGTSISFQFGIVDPDGESYSLDDWADNGIGQVLTPQVINMSDEFYNIQNDIINPTISDLGDNIFEVNIVPGTNYFNIFNQWFLDGNSAATFDIQLNVIDAADASLYATVNFIDFNVGDLFSVNYLDCNETKNGINLLDNILTCCNMTTIDDCGMCPQDDDGYGCGDGSSCGGNTGENSSCLGCLNFNEYTLNYNNCLDYTLTNTLGQNFNGISCQQSILTNNGTTYCNYRACTDSEAENYICNLPLGYLICQATETPDTDYYNELASTSCVYDGKSIEIVKDKGFGRSGDTFSIYALGEDTKTKSEYIGHSYVANSIQLSPLFTWYDVLYTNNTNSIEGLVPNPNYGGWVLDKGVGVPDYKIDLYDSTGTILIKELAYFSNYDCNITFGVNGHVNGSGVDWSMGPGQFELEPEWFGVPGSHPPDFMTDDLDGDGVGDAYSPNNNIPWPWATPYTIGTYEASGTGQHGNATTGTEMGSCKSDLTPQVNISIADPEESDDFSHTSMELKAKPHVICGSELVAFPSEDIFSMDNVNTDNPYHSQIFPQSFADILDNHLTFSDEYRQMLYSSNHVGLSGLGHDSHIYGDHWAIEEFNPTWDIPVIPAVEKMRLYMARPGYHSYGYSDSISYWQVFANHLLFGQQFNTGPDVWDHTTGEWIFPDNLGFTLGWYEYFWTTVQQMDLFIYNDKIPTGTWYDAEGDSYEVNTNIESTYDSDHPLTFPYGYTGEQICQNYYLQEKIGYQDFVKNGLRLQFGPYGQIPDVPPGDYKIKITATGRNYGSTNLFDGSERTNGMAYDGAPQDTIEIFKDINYEYTLLINDNFITGSDSLKHVANPTIAMDITGSYIDLVSDNNPITYRDNWSSAGGYEPGDGNCIGLQKYPRINEKFGAYVEGLKEITTEQAYKWILWDCDTYITKDSQGIAAQVAPNGGAPEDISDAFNYRAVCSGPNLRKDGGLTNSIWESNFVDESYDEVTVDLVKNGEVIFHNPKLACKSMIETKKWLERNNKDDRPILGTFSYVDENISRGKYTNWEAIAGDSLGDEFSLSAINSNHRISYIDNLHYYKAGTDEFDPLSSMHAYNKQDGTYNWVSSPKNGWWKQHRISPGGCPASIFTSNHAYHIKKFKPYTIMFKIKSDIQNNDGGSGELRYNVVFWTKGSTIHSSGIKHHIVPQVLDIGNGEKLAIATWYSGDQDEILHSLYLNFMDSDGVPDSHWEGSYYCNAYGTAEEYGSYTGNPAYNNNIHANSKWSYIELKDLVIYEGIGNFIPDVDVRIQKSIMSTEADLTHYYHITSSEYQETMAPCEAQFYFYGREGNSFISDTNGNWHNVFIDNFYDTHGFHHYDDPGNNNTKNKQRPSTGLNHHLFKPNEPIVDSKDYLYVAFIDWGDGSPIEFDTEPKLIGPDSIVSHTYTNGGVYEIKGVMFSAVKDKNGKNNGVGLFKHFTTRININKNLEIQNEFRYLGGRENAFIPYQNTTPIIGGISENSLYKKIIRRNLGYLDLGSDFIYKSDLLVEIAINTGYNKAISIYNQWCDNALTEGEEESTIDDVDTACDDLQTLFEGDNIPYPPEFYDFCLSNFYIPISVCKEYMKENYNISSSETICDELDNNTNGFLDWEDLKWFETNKGGTTPCSANIPEGSVPDQGYQFNYSNYKTFNPKFKIYTDLIDMQKNYLLMNDDVDKFKELEGFIDFSNTDYPEYSAGIEVTKKELGDYTGPIDLGQTRLIKKPLQMWELLGFKSQTEPFNHPGNPKSSRFYKNIVPKNYPLYARFGVAYNLIPQTENFSDGKTTDEYSLGNRKVFKINNDRSERCTPTGNKAIKTTIKGIFTGDWEDNIFLYATPTTEGDSLTDLNWGIYKIIDVGQDIVGFSEASIPLTFSAWIKIPEENYGGVDYNTLSITLTTGSDTDTAMYQRNLFTISEPPTPSDEGYKVYSENDGWRKIHFNLEFTNFLNDGWANSKSKISVLLSFLGNGVTNNPGNIDKFCYWSSLQLELGNEVHNFDNGVISIDPTSSQTYVGRNKYGNNYYYPVLPKLNELGVFQLDSIQSQALEEFGMTTDEFINEFFLNFIVDAPAEDYWAYCINPENHDIDFADSLSFLCQSVLDNAVNDDGNLDLLDVISVIDSIVQGSNIPRIPYGDRTTWNEQDTTAYITNNLYQDVDLIIDFNSETLQKNILQDNSGNANIGFVISDYLLEFDETTYSPKYIENYDSIFIENTEDKAY